MNLVYFSNTHGHHRELALPLGEMLICGGGITKTGTEDQTIEFIRWFGAQKHRYKIFIGGATDKALDPLYGNKGDISHHILAELDNFTYNKKNYYLDNTSVVIEGLVIHGTPYKPHTEKDEAFCAPHRQLTDVYRKISKDVNILITSFPPYNKRDYVPENNTHVGNTLLSTWIGVALPDLVLTGGVHQSRGIQYDGNRAYVNGSVYDPDLRDVREPWTLRYIRETGKTKIWRNEVLF